MPAIGFIDSRSATALTERLLGRMNLVNASQLVNAVQNGEWDRSRIAGLAVDVIRAADEGDPLANEIVESQIAALADCVLAVATSLNLDRSNLPLALAGSLLTKSPTYRDRLLMRLKQLGLQASHVVEISEPAEGALRLAFQKLSK